MPQKWHQYTSAAVNAAKSGTRDLIAAPGAGKQLWIFGIMGTVDANGTVLFLDDTPTSHSGVMPVAANSGYVYAYGLILTFALGHSLLLLAAGVSVGFAQSITSNSTLAKFSTYLNKGFALMLITFAAYFGYEAYLQL